MRQLLRLILVGGMLMTTSLVSRADDLAADLAQIHLEAIGGAERVERLQSFRAAGISQVGEVSLEFQMWAARPARIRLEVQSGRQMLIQGWDGEGEPWLQGGPDGPVQIMPAQLAQRFKLESQFDTPLINAEARGYALEYAGEDEVYERPVVKLLATRGANDQSTLYLAADTYFIVRQDRLRYNLAGERIQTVTLYDDFRPILGVILPHQIRIYDNDVLVSDVMLNWVEPNPPMEDGMFSTPEQPTEPESSAAE